MAKSELKVLVLSDLHCRYKPQGQKVNTRLYSNLLPKPSLRHPIEALKSLALKQSLSVDYILCPGDITDKSDDQGYLSGFGFLRDLRSSLNAKHLICTVGNHDLDSRGKFFKSYDEAPKGVHTDYPFPGIENQAKFWTNHFCLCIADQVAILVFNSSFSHTSEANAARSYIDENILAQMEEELRALDQAISFRIALCHHHPSKHANLSYKDEDVIDQGDLLLKLLYKYDFQLLIHGHKHDPRLSYFNSLPVLCAGSFSSFENTQESDVGNLFHIISLSARSKFGRIETYRYGPHEGWTAKHGNSFPSFSGFGYQHDLKQLAADCGAWLKSNSKDVASFDDLKIAIPNVSHLIPEDQVKLNTELTAIGLTFTPDLPDLPRLISKAQ